MTKITKNKIRVCFILPDLNRGGAQRIMSYLALNLDKSIFTCSLLIVSSPKTTDFKTITIEVKYLNKNRLLSASLPLFYNLASQKYDIVIGSIGHINKILGFFSMLIKKTKFIGREDTLSTVIQEYNKSERPVIDCFLNDYRRKLDALICQSDDMANDVIKTYNVKPEKVFTINNPLTKTIQNSFSTSPSRIVKQLITIGRLSKEKGHKRIINILSKIVKIRWHYTIVGEGEEIDNIKSQIKSLDLDNQITIIPYLDIVDDVLLNSDLFLQGSYVEGFPNATLESILFGTPVIAFKAPGGTKEIISNEINGYIAVNEDDYLTLIIIALTEIKWDRKTISNSVSEKFNSKFILAKYQNLFLNINNSK